MSKEPKAAAAPAPAPAPAEAPAAEGPAPKVKKERKEKKPKANVQVWKLYKVEGETAQRLRRECPRCGKGFFMAEHKDRFSCGHCGFTNFKNK